MSSTMIGLIKVLELVSAFMDDFYDYEEESMSLSDSTDI